MENNVVSISMAREKKQAALSASARHPAISIKEVDGEEIEVVNVDMLSAEEREAFFNGTFFWPRMD